MMGIEPKSDEIRKIDLNNFLFLGFSTGTSGLADALKQADEYVGSIFISGKAGALRAHPEEATTARSP